VPLLMIVLLVAVVAAKRLPGTLLCRLGPAATTRPAAVPPPSVTFR